MTSEEEIILDFETLPTWEEKYEYIIELGKNSQFINPKLTDKKHLLEGCQSKVWIKCEVQKDRVVFIGNSDALITRGLVALIIKLYSKNCENDWKKLFLTGKIESGNHHVLKKIGIVKHLSMTRAQGLSLMEDKIKNYAFVWIQKLKLLNDEK